MLRDFRASKTAKILSWFKNPRNLVISLLVLVVAAGLWFFVFGSKREESKPTVKIDRSYTIVAKTKEGQRTDGRLKLTVLNAQIAPSILVQGKVARPVKGKVFLVLNLEIENSYKVPLYTLPVDLFRFIGGGGQKYPPSTSQGRVEIRPESTKKSNVAFVVTPGDKKFKIEVGDVNESKELLEITFK